MKKIISILLSIILIFSTSIYAFAENDTFTTTKSSRGISLLANYHTEALDKGLLYINEYNQELLIKRTDISTFGNDSQFNIIWYYSSIGSVYEKELPYGSGWKTNYDISLKYDEKLGEFVYLHDDGATVNFSKTNEKSGEYTYWKENISIMCLLDELYVKTGSTSTSDAYIKTKFNEILKFNEDGKIISIEKGNEMVRIDYCETGISRITDPSGRIIVFSYNSDDLVSEIAVRNANKDLIYIGNDSKRTPYIIKYSYNSNNELENVRFPDGNIIKYKYSNNKLNTIKGFDGNEYLVNYKLDRVISLSQYANSQKRNIVEYDRNGNCITKYTTFGEKSYNYNEFGLLEMDNEHKKKLLDETGQMVLEDEIATKERVSKCNCEDCKIVNCNCSCENSMICRCFACELSSKIEGNNKSLETLDNKTSNEKNELGIIEKTIVISDSVYDYDYDCNLNLTKISIELSKLSDIIIENNYKYEDGKLVLVSNQNTEYNLSYDIWGNPSGFSIGTEDKVKYEYKDGNPSYIDVINYGNDQVISYQYQKDGKISKMYCNGILTFSYNYLPDDSIEINNHTNSTILSIRDDTYQISDINGKELFSIIDGKESRAYTVCIGDTSFDVKWQYLKNEDTYSLQCITDSKNNEVIVDIVSDYNDANKLTVVSVNDKNLFGYSNKKSNTQKETIETLDVFVDSSNTNIKHWETFSNKNRISKIYLDDKVYATYKYDEIGELIYSENELVNYIEEFTYDDSGNLITRKALTNTGKNKIHTYRYSDLLWGDKLTAFDGKNIEYDSIGNPIKYGDNTYSWTNGRSLKTIKNDKYFIKFEYDDSGLRTSKTVYDVETLSQLYKYRYYWSNGFLVGYDYTDTVNGTFDTITYLIDNEGNNHGYIINDNDVYLYERNPLNEIVAIWHEGKPVSTYSYSAFGEVISNNNSIDDNISLNIMFYKDYIYDKEINMYYLQSRYYVPEWGRFLNADVYIDTGTGVLGTNMFAYCENDPVNYVDPSGFWKINKNDNSHDKLTRLLYEGENYEFLNDMIAGNVSIDENYSALIPTNEKQKYHFDRKNQMSEYSGDTRAEMASVWLHHATNFDSNTSPEAWYIGQALHSMQDVAAHGNIGIHHIFAAHGTHEDSRFYVWKDSTRGENTPQFESSVEFTLAEQTRWREAQEASVATIVLYAFLRSAENQER